LLRMFKQSLMLNVRETALNCCLFQWLRTLNEPPPATLLKSNEQETLHVTAKITNHSNHHTGMACITTQPHVPHTAPGRQLGLCQGALPAAFDEVSVRQGCYRHSSSNCKLFGMWLTMPWNAMPRPSCLHHFVSHPPCT
jgi:hypothetical protein